MRIPDSIVARVFEPLWDAYERSARLRELRALRRSQWLPHEQLVAAQSLDLQSLVKHAAATCTFYRRRFADAGIDPSGVRDIHDLAALPLLTKDDIRHSGAALVSSKYAAAELVKAKTGGSTGVALEIVCDLAGVQRRAGAALRADEWSGWRLGQPWAAVWGNPPAASTFKQRLRRWLKDRVIFLDTMHIDDPAVDRFLVEWRRMRPGLLFGHAHSLFILAEHLRERGLRLAPTGIVATSMMLLEHERRAIEAVCGKPVTNRYGCEEVSLIACECEVHSGLHLNSEHVIVEILREDGRPCKPGEDGRIVVTDLTNFAQPLIRYEVGDHGVASDLDCPCGRGLPLLASITGRTADFLVAAGGHRVAGISIIENTLTKLTGLRQMQIVQEAPLVLTVNVVPGQGYSKDVAAELVETLRSILGVGFAVDIRLVDRIPQEKNGKFRFTICRLG